MIPRHPFHINLGPLALTNHDAKQFRWREHRYTRLVWWLYRRQRV